MLLFFVIFNIESDERSKIYTKRQNSKETTIVFELNVH